MSLDFDDISKEIKFNLKKKDYNLHNLQVILEFDSSPYTNGDEDEDEFDADLNLAVLERNGDKTITLPDGAVVPKMKFYAESRKSLIYFHNNTSLNGEIEHDGDVRNGGGEKATIHLDKVPNDVDEITIFGLIHEGFKRHQNWKALNATIALINLDTGKTIKKYSLGSKFSEDDAIHFGSLFRDEEGEWEFIPHGVGYKNMGLKGFIDFWQPG